MFAALSVAYGPIKGNIQLLTMSLESGAYRIGIPKDAERQSQKRMSCKEIDFM